jgi:hypothetical protein
MQHPSGIPEKIVRKVFARRGRLHAFEAIDPKTTALVVIDLDEATVANDDVSQCMTETVNALAAAVRQGGGLVAWVLSRMTAMPRHFTAILGADLATRYFNDGQPGGAGTRLWHALDRKPDDVVAIKAGASAFFPGKCAEFKHHSLVFPSARRPSDTVCRRRSWAIAIRGARFLLHRSSDRHPAAGGPDSERWRRPEDANERKVGSAN